MWRQQDSGTPLWPRPIPRPSVALPSYRSQSGCSCAWGQAPAVIQRYSAGQCLSFPGRQNCVGRETQLGPGSPRGQSAGIRWEGMGGGSQPRILTNASSFSVTVTTGEEERDGEQ